MQHTRAADLFELKLTFPPITTPLGEPISYSKRAYTKSRE